MVPYSIARGDITPQDIKALEVANGVMREIGDNSPILITCHILARLVETQIKNGKCIDGHFVGGWRHSWIQLDSTNILDVYPIAASNPFVVVGQNSNRIFQPWANFYMPAKLDFVNESSGHPDKAARRIRPDWFKR